MVVLPDRLRDDVRLLGELLGENILEYADQPLVSTDIIGNSHSSIYDAAFTQVNAGQFIRVLNWFDNEWGYSSRVCDLLRLLKAL